MSFPVVSIPPLSKPKPIYRSPAKKNMEKFNKNAVSSCIRVMSIPELRDKIFLQHGQKLTDWFLAKYSLVCFHWYNIFAPMLSGHIRVHWGGNTINKINKHTGPRLRSIRGENVTRHLIRLLQKHSSRIEILDLFLSIRHPAITPQDLQAVINRSARHLTTVLLEYESAGGMFDLALVRGLAKAPNVRTLGLYPFCAQSCWEPIPSSNLISILACCPKLERYAIGGAGAIFHSEDGPEPLLPSSPLYAIKDGKHRAQRLGFLTKHGLGLDRGSEEQQSAYKMPMSPLQLLILEQPVPNFKRLNQLLGCCPSLQEINLRGHRQGGWGNIGLDLWTSLSLYCPQIKTIFFDLISISPQQPEIPYAFLTVPDIPEVADFIAWFPRLESLHLGDINFPKDPDISTLHQRLQEHEEEYGDRHPLKILFISGRIRQSLRIQLEIMQAQTNISNFTAIGLDDTILQAHDIHTLCHSETYLQAPWRCQESLRILDIHGIYFPTQAALLQFFTRLQSLNRLHTLRLSHQHIFYLSTSIPEHAYIQPGDFTTTATGIYTSNMTQLPSTGIRLPGVQTINIINQDAIWAHRHEALTWEFCLFMIASTPSLSVLTGRWSATLLRQLEAVFPKIEFSEGHEYPRAFYYEQGVFGGLRKYTRSAG